MPEFLPPWPLFSAFLAASLALAVMPGPGVLYIVARSVSQGTRAGLASVMGVALGNLANALLAAWGLAALFAWSNTAFLLVKVAGAFYLIFLGVQTWRGPRRTAAHTPRPTTGHAFRDGILVALLNPKTTIFFAAFLPQFMSTHASAATQGSILGLLFVAIALVTDSIYALSAAALQTRLARTPGLQTWTQRMAGGLLIGLGCLAAWTCNPLKLK